jgi:hypothetical protein
MMMMMMMMMMRCSFVPIRGRETSRSGRTIPAYSRYVFEQDCAETWREEEEEEEGSRMACRGRRDGRGKEEGI